MSPTQGIEFLRDLATRHPGIAVELLDCASIIEQFLARGYRSPAMYVDSPGGGDYKLTVPPGE